jgi:radical SAM superfamily enzyme YgiQ (UPF0313 family)
VPVVIGGIEASLRRIAHYDYWSDQVRRSILLDAKADILIYGNAERAAGRGGAPHRASGETIDAMHDIRGTAVIRKEPLPGWGGFEQAQIGRIDPIMNPYMEGAPCSDDARLAPAAAGGQAGAGAAAQAPSPTYVKLPAFERVKADKVLYAHAPRASCTTRPTPATPAPLVPAHGDRIIWVNPPADPAGPTEMDGVYGLPYSGCRTRPMARRRSRPTR